MTALQATRKAAPGTLNREVFIKLTPRALHMYDIEVLTAEGAPSELSVIGVDRPRASKVLAELPTMLAECPEAADFSVARVETVRAMAKAGIQYSRGAALAARPRIADSTWTKKYPAFRLG